MKGSEELFSRHCWNESHDGVGEGKRGDIELANLVKVHVGLRKKSRLTKRNQPTPTSGRCVIKGPLSEHCLQRPEELSKTSSQSRARQGLSNCGGK
jgi:hypothetical protein